MNIGNYIIQIEFWTYEYYFSFVGTTEENKSYTFACITDLIRELNMHKLDAIINNYKVRFEKDNNIKFRAGFQCNFFALIRKYRIFNIKISKKNEENN